MDIQLGQLKKSELEAYAKQHVKGLRGVSRLTKAELLAKILAQQDQDQTRDQDQTLDQDQTREPTPPEEKERGAPTFIEVCAGCGGMSTGFMNAGFEPLLLNELIPTFCQTLQKNHPGARVDNGSMLDLDLSEFKNQVDVLQGGVPCQSFSHAGERKGLEDPRGQLIVQFNNLVLTCEPRMFVVENVRGLVTHEGGQTLRNVKSMFENDGMYTVQHQVLNANDYDVPQKRERVFIVGVHREVSEIRGAFEYPAPSTLPQTVLRDVLTEDIRDGLGMKYAPAKAEVLAQVGQGQCWVNLPPEVQAAYMGEKSLAAGGGKRGIARRLSMDEPSLTLTTSPCQKQTERCHPLETRPLNIREYARIQTFPDSYTFCGSVGNQYKQIGNAVPVKLAEAMARQIRHFLDI
jgi:DNA (cytosine-5)-methyltransferase 1